MHHSNILALLAATAGAQSVVTILNIFEYQSTLTQIGADSTAMTYKKDCASPVDGRTGSSSKFLSNSKPTTAITPRPSTTSRARLARQNSVSDGFDQGEADDAMCEPYTITQGISSWAMHLKDPNPGYWTLDANCKWQGALSAADVTCTLSQSGSFASTFGDYTVTSDVIVHSSLEQGGFFSAVTVVKGSDVVQSSQASAAISKTGSPTSKPAATTGASAGSASASQSTGMAPLPTAAVVLLGGAAGVLAAALAL